jgi:hypothetical protein
VGELARRGKEEEQRQASQPTSKALGLFNSRTVLLAAVLPCSASARSQGPSRFWDFFGHMQCKYAIAMHDTSERTCSHVG